MPILPSVLSVGPSTDPRGRIPNPFLPVVLHRLPGQDARANLLRTHSRLLDLARVYFEIERVWDRRKADGSRRPARLNFGREDAVRSILGDLQGEVEAGWYRCVRAADAASRRTLDEMGDAENRSEAVDAGPPAICDGQDADEP